MVRRLFSAFALVVIGTAAAVAQVGSGSLKGSVKDKKSGEPLPFVNVVVENKGTQVAGGATDFDGNYFIKPIDPGSYDVVVSFVGYQPLKQTGVVISSNKITFLDLDLSAGIELSEYEVIQYNVPLIDRDGGASGGTVTRDDIAKMPGRSAASIATTVAGASDAGTGGGISIRGGRTENTYYYIDGVKVPASAGTGLPKSAIEEVQVITGGVPANYGDVTGGVVNITTRGPSRSFFGGLEYLTSGFKFGSDVTDIYGLDKYAFNQAEASLSGPIFFRKDSVGNKTRPLIGFFLSGQFTNVQDDNPYYGGSFRVKEDVRARLLESPLSIRELGTTQSVVYNSNFLRADDIESIPTRMNAARTSYLASGKIDIATTPTINLTAGGSFEYVDRQNHNRTNALLNSENNYQYRDLTWRGFLKFTQRFNSRDSDGEDAGSKIKNAYYTLQVDYSRYDQLVEDPVHKDNFFDYGYVGKFTTYRAPTYELTDIDTSINEQFAWVHTGFRDTLVTFEPSETNADVAAITTQYFDLFDYAPFQIPNLFGGQAPSGPYENFVQIQSLNGLVNGERPSTLYNLWNNLGYLDDPNGGEYRKFQQDQFRVSAVGSADIQAHAVSVGVEYEQLTTRAYSLAPIGLWTRARQLANFHLLNLDNQNSDGVVDYSLGSITYPLGTVPFYTFGRNVGDDQTYFDSQLREELGLDPNGTDFINVDEIDPSTFSLDMFSPQELINDGNALVTYYGFDHLGNRLTGRSSFEDFFDEIGDNGQNTRAQAPFAPIYMAGYVMDKFAFDDIIFNVGVRVDRYDANQNVLKDKYLWRPAYTAGDDMVQNLYSENSPRPGNIGDDYVVYVDRLEDPTRVLGYRDGDVWYDANGQVLADPSILRVAEGIAPYLVDYAADPNGDLPGSSLKKSAFEDYKPTVNVMPRIAFSFPISDEAVFFAHYDVLTQRPTSNSRLDLPNLAYIQTTNNIQNNAALKPSKTIDYELGFQQVLSKSSSLKLAVFYRELRDMIQIRNVVEAWPQTYRTYDNFDFGTVKGLSATFDLRRTGNVWMRASYTLQFADGTGSGPNTGLNLINSGQPNLRTINPLDFDQRHRIQVTTDFRYGSGKDYNGPMLFKSPIFQRTGINVVSILGSGTPYSPSSRIVQEGAIVGGSGTHRLEGSINGARLPWQFTMDGQLDKDIPLTFGKDKEGDKAKTANLNIYLLVTNILNTQNVTGVYRGTGSPENDGYLASPQFENDILLQVDPQAYRDLYALKVDNPNNYGTPRTIRLGLRFDF